MDNDLMARRLRPPSEPPRPQNGHAPVPSDTPPWAVAQEPAAEVPWDRPDPEPWPPSTTDEQHSPEVWPPTPAPAAAEPDGVISQAMWQSSPVADETTPVDHLRPHAEPVWADPVEIWPEPSPWQPVAPELPQSTTNGSNGSSGSTYVLSGEPDPTVDPAVPAWPETPTSEAFTYEAPTYETPIAEEATRGDSDMAVAGRAPWDKPEPYGWDPDERVDDRVDDRPADMLASYDDMIPVVSRFVAAATTPPEPVAARQPAAAEPVVQSPVEPAIAAPVPAAKPTVAQDPYDAFAPVLNDVEAPSAPSWPAWSTGADSEPARQPVQPEFSGRAVGPTPPDDLFGRPASPVSPEPELQSPPLDREPRGAVAPDTQAVASSRAPEPVAQYALEQQVPQVYSTAPAVPQQPLVLRIELAIVDETNRVRPADAARRVGPAIADDVDAETLTPRHPEFEPRNHIAPPAAEEIVEHEPTPETDFVPEPTLAPWADTAERTREVADLPWALPPLEPIATHAPQPQYEPQPHYAPQPQPAPQRPAQQPDVTPWSRAPHPVQPVPPLPPQPQSQWQPAPATPEPAPAPSIAAADVWADPNPTASWTLAAPPQDPLAALPAATFLTPPEQPVAPQSMQPAYAAQVAPSAAPQYDPSFESAPQAAALAPAAATAAAPAALAAPAPLAAAPARPAANAAQSDLWFLASEPEVVEPEQEVTDKPAGQPSTLMTAGLTVAMAVVVIVLVLVFIQLMTSLLR